MALVNVVVVFVVYVVVWTLRTSELPQTKMAAHIVKTKQSSVSLFEILIANTQVAQSTTRRVHVLEDESEL